MEYQYVIVGGGIAGVTAAETIRENDSLARIAIISEESEILYSRVLLPSYLKKRIRRQQLFLRRPSDFTAKRIDLRMNERVAWIDTKHRDVIFENGITVGYEKLLLATGGRVKEWSDSQDQQLVFRLQTLEDADRLNSAMDYIHNPLVVGASFISLEFLEIFTVRGIAPVLVVRDKHFFSHFVEEQGGQLFNDNFERHGIQTVYNDVIAEVKPAQPPDASAQSSGLRQNGTSEMKAITRGLVELPCDAIAVGIGIERPLAYLEGSGIERGEKGIGTNQFLETSQPDVFAAGDTAEFFDVIYGQHKVDGNWTNAVLQGKRAALNMMGEKQEFRAVAGYSISNLGFQITVLGWCEDAGDSIVRVEWGKKQYERLFIRDGVIVGAVLVNRFADRTHIAKLIEARVSLNPWRDKLVDMAFDIHQIPVIP